VIFGSFPTAFIGFGMQAEREWRQKKPSGRKALIIQKTDGLVLFLLNDISRSSRGRSDDDA
jgi:hypothetical protein